MSYAGTRGAGRARTGCSQLQGRQGGDGLGEMLTVKPILHCDAKPFVLGTGAGLDSHNFALPIPTCWYLKNLKTCNPTRILKFVSPNPKPPTQVSGI